VDTICGLLIEFPSSIVFVVGVPCPTRLYQLIRDRRRKLISQLLLAMLHPTPSRVPGLPRQITRSIQCSTVYLHRADQCSLGLVSNNISPASGPPDGWRPMLHPRRTPAAPLYGEIYMRRDLLRLRIKWAYAVIIRIHSVHH
jgi:hypothetical protein